MDFYKLWRSPRRLGAAALGGAAARRAAAGWGPPGGCLAHAAAGRAARPAGRGRACSGAAARARRPGGAGGGVSARRLGRAPPLTPAAALAMYAGAGRPAPSVSQARPPLPVGPCVADEYAISRSCCVLVVTGLSSGLSSPCSSRYSQYVNFRTGYEGGQCMQRR